MLGQQLIIATIISLSFSGGSTSGCRAEHNTGSQVNKPSVPEEDNKVSSELKVLAEGFHSSITSPFVAVIRDEETYLALNNLEGKLPKLEADFFKSKVLIAAFLGQRNTGGFSVQIVQSADGEIRVSEAKPGKGMMVPQMITSPFRMVSVSVGKSSPVRLVLDPVWNSSMRNYSVTNGTFTMTGGIAGRSEKFRLAGHVGLLREQGLITFSFRLWNNAEKNKVMLADFATGMVQDSGVITIPVLSAGALVNPPNDGLKARGQLTNNDAKISIDFASLTSMIADGFSGMGRFEAVMVLPTAKTTGLS